MIYRDGIHEVVKKYGDKTALICQDRPFTFQDLNETSNRIIAYLRRLELRKGDKIALLCRSCHHYREMLWVAGKGGFVLVPVNGRLKPKEARYIINNSEARVLMISLEFAGTVKEIKADVKRIEHFFSLDAGVEGFPHLGALIKSYPTEDLCVELKEDDLLWFQYTSGTTGLPKGAIHTQGTACAIIDSINLVKDALREGSRVLHVLPLYSFAGMAFDLVYQWIGALTVIMPKFDVSEMMRLIEKYRITDCHIVPVILNFLLNAPDLGKYNLSSLKCITYGGAPMSPDLLKRGIEKFGPIFMQDYGASEAGALTFLYMEDHVLEGPPEKVKRLASCGRPIPGADVKVLNDAGEEVKPGEIGELTVKSPMVMKGYWKMPEETNEALKDGRFYTGDLCTVDEEGYIYIQDRKKDLIISGGMNIYPYEIERVILEHPAILDAAVIGIPDDIWGEAVCAVVVSKPGKLATEEEIIDHVKSKLASYKKPKKVDVIDAIPRTLSGKILKKDLRKKYWEGRERKV